MRALYRAGLLPISLTLLLVTILIGAHVLRSRDQETAWRLAASEERYRLFLQNFIGIAYQSDPQTLRPILFHGTAAEITGYAAEEFLSGRIIWEQLIHPDDRAAARALHEKTVTTPGFVADHLYRIMHRDGNMRWVRDIARYQQGTDSSCIQGVVQDITDRKQAESQREAALEALRAERDRAQGYLDTVETIIVALNREGRITAINRKGCQLLGYAEAELVGQSWFDACLPQPDGMEKVYPYFLRLLAGGQITEYFENPIVTRSGAQRQIAWHNALLRDAQGKIIGTLGSGEDITERVRAEESLQATLAELQRSNAELEQFAYIASHDLQEPLRMVTSFVQLLADRYRGQLDADADEFIGYATDGAKRMQQLILDLLEYSRVGTRGQPPQPTNAAAALADALWNLGLTIEDTRAIVTHDPLPVVLADSVQLSQLFQNLIGNAIKFRGAEPPRVHISARETSPRETFEVSETSKVWEFAVRDNGIGIEPQYFERIFVIFQRLHKRSEYPGTGIGLAICKKIVERHGGRIWVESQPEQGSAFYFTLSAA
jgi:PAS domain S-box-containing protein